MEERQDLISRQAAIDALTEHAKWLQERYHETCSLPGMIRVIEELPSVEPEIIRCKDCRWYKKERGWHGIEYTVCKLSPINRPIREEDDFCSRAERREEGEQNG